MSVRLTRNPLFTADVQHRFGRYWDQAGETIAWRFASAVEEILKEICRQPSLGRQRSFTHPQLQGLRSFRLNPPFNKHVFFYRFNGGEVEAWRLMHGARDLARRLLQAPNAE
jgi:toxin ParE1/3/4